MSKNLWGWSTVLNRFHHIQYFPVPRNPEKCEKFKKKCHNFFVVKLTSGAQLEEQKSSVHKKLALQAVEF